MIYSEKNICNKNKCFFIDYNKAVRSGLSVVIIIILMFIKTLVCATYNVIFFI